MALRCGLFPKVAFGGIVSVYTGLRLRVEILRSFGSIVSFYTGLRLRVEILRLGFREEALHPTPQMLGCRSLLGLSWQDGPFVSGVPEKGP